MKRGFSIVELIFTIIILAICTIVIPKIISQTTKSTAFATKQELVLNSKTLMSQIVKMPWDSSYKAQGNCATSVDPNRCAIINLTPVPIYNIPSAGGDVNFANRIGIDIYTSDTSGRSFDTMSIYAPATKSDFGYAVKSHSFGYQDISADADIYNDIDDYDGVNIIGINVNLVDNSTGDFIVQSQANIDVKFVSDAMSHSGGTYSANLGIENLDLTNIKLIEVMALDENEKDIFVILRSYVFNIGTPSIRRVQWE